MIVMAATKGRKSRKNRKVVNVGKLYKDGKLKNKVCPKCGAGFVMAEHANRISCGKCGYTEFKK
jgi:ubiquitin-small subunit ribosomal protein S27Ae